MSLAEYTRIKCGQKVRYLYKVLSGRMGSSTIEYSAKIGKSLNRTGSSFQEAQWAIGIGR